jgi:hypothetical protein
VIAEVSSSLSPSLDVVVHELSRNSALALKVTEFSLLLSARKLTYPYEFLPLIQYGQCELTHLHEFLPLTQCGHCEAAKRLAVAIQFLE